MGAHYRGKSKAALFLHADHTNHIGTHAGGLESNRLTLSTLANHHWLATHEIVVADKDKDVALDTV